MSTNKTQENSYEIVEGVYGNLIIYKDGSPFIPTNIEPFDEADEAWEKIGGIVDALIDERSTGQRLRHEATAALEFLQEWEASDFEAATDDESVQSSFHMVVEGLKRALLQSEKGGE